jgi:beta-glucanase (GH16 family)
MRYLYLLASALLLSIILAFSCKKESSKAVPNILLNTQASVYEDITEGTLNLPVSLSAATDKTVTISYSTVDSTAKAGMDYTAVLNATITFQSGETSKFLEVKILPDSARKEDVWFKIILSNIANAVLQNSSISVKVINVDYSTLAWSDEFNDTTLNTSNWNYELGDNSGWGNNELESYTSSKNNVYTQDGFLYIKAIKQGISSYTSGRITTQGKKEFTFGRIDIRAKLPEGQGIWPALWMLGSNISTVGWPICGEIDIMEELGQQPDKVYFTAHYNNNGHQSSGGNYSLPGASFSNDFHIFSLLWQPTRLKWYVDNKEYFSVNNNQISGFPMDLPQFFIFNVAVGGNWPGSPDATTVFPQSMVVDYIRVYQ